VTSLSRSLTLVSNTIFAHVLLGETVTRRDVFATIGIVVGSALAVLTASHEDELFEYVPAFISQGLA